MGLLSFIGGLYVAYLAWECFQSGEMESVSVDAQPRSLRKGVVLNLLNPAPYLFWATVGGPLIVQQQEARAAAAALFLSSFYALLVGSKLALAWLTGKSRHLLSRSGYLRLMRFLGLLLIGFAFLLFKKAVTLSWG
jgi:threonine/homoserine/homoserine lactone efflux protein